MPFQNFETMFTDIFEILIFPLYNVLSYTVQLLTEIIFVNQQTAIYVRLNNNKATAS